VTGARTNVPELTGVPQPDLVLLNDDDEGYALIRFDPRSLATVAASIGQLTDGLARAVCWAALLDMVRQAELAVPDFAAIVTGGIGGETSISVLQLLLAESSELIERFARPAQAPAVLGALAGECSRLLHAAAPGTDHQLAFAEALAWSATTSGQLDEVAGMRAGTMVVPGLVVGTELRWSLLGQLAAMGRATDADVDAELAADPTDGGRRHALACRAAMPDAGHKAAAWELLTGASPLGFETAMIVGRAFSRVAGAAAGPELLAPYVSRYFEMLPRIWAGRSEQFRLVLSHVLFPYWAASEELNAQVSAFLGTGNRNGGLVRALIECQDGSARIVRSRALPGVSETPIT
jgi:aminopeptidase N